MFFFVGNIFKEYPYVYYSLDINLLNVQRTKIYDVKIGNRDWMRHNGMVVTAGMEKTMTEHEEQGHTAVMCAIDGMFSVQFFIVYKIRMYNPVNRLSPIFSYTCSSSLLIGHHEPLTNKIYMEINPNVLRKLR